MRRLIVGVLFALGCAASTGGTDGGVDMSASQCDVKTLFTSCTAQCGFHVCGIGKASCDAGQWQCDCTQAVICASPGDGGNHD